MRVTLADGGYLSWVYGARAATRNGWNAVHKKYSGYYQVIVVMDSEFSIRKSIFPDYKSHREDRMKKNPEIFKRRQSVMQFKANILEDYSLERFILPGFEADDLIGIVPLIERGDLPIAVYGQDKDLLQLPAETIALKKHDEIPVLIANFVRRLPVTIAQYVDSPKKVLLTLALLGDSSDDIPRIIPPGKLNLLATALQVPNEQLFSRAAELFGDKFLINLNLTVLPGPWSFEPSLPMSQIPEALDNDTYYQQTIKPEIQMTFQRVKSSMFSRAMALRIEKDIMWELGF